MVRQGTVETQHDNLRGAGVPADTDLSIEPGLTLLVATQKHDDAARVLAACFVGGLDGFLGIPGVPGADDERQHSPQGDSAAGLTHLDQFLADLDRGGGGQIENH